VRHGHEQDAGPLRGERFAPSSSAVSVLDAAEDGLGDAALAVEPAVPSELLEPLFAHPVVHPYGAGFYHGSEAVIKPRAGRAPRGLSKFVGFAVAVLLVLSASLLAVGAYMPLAALSFAAWPLFFLLDAASTRRIYLRSPKEFEHIERNRVFVALVRRMGVVPAFPAFLALAEIPIFAFISLVIAPALGAYILGGASIVPCLSAGAGVLAFTHAQAWGQNRGALETSPRTNLHPNQKRNFTSKLATSPSPQSSLGIN